MWWGVRSLLLGEYFSILPATSSWRRYIINLYVPFKLALWLPSLGNSVIAGLWILHCFSYFLSIGSESEMSESPFPWIKGSGISKWVLCFSLTHLPEVNSYFDRHYRWYYGVFGKGWFFCIFCFSFLKFVVSSSLAAYFQKGFQLLVFCL